MYDQDFSFNESDKDQPRLSDQSTSVSAALWECVVPRSGDKSECTREVPPELTQKEKLELAKNTADKLISGGDIGKEAFDQISQALRSGRDIDLIGMINRELAGRSDLSISLHNKFVKLRREDILTGESWTDIALIDKTKIKDQAGTSHLTGLPAGCIHNWPVMKTSTTYNLKEGAAPRTTHEYYQYQPKNLSCTFAPQKNATPILPLKLYEGTP